jgi:hypothetical protein
MTHCLLLSFFNLPDAIYYVWAWRRVAILGVVYLSVSLGPQSYLLLPCHFLKSFIPSGTQFCKAAIEILHNGCAPFKGVGSLGSWISCVLLADNSRGLRHLPALISDLWANQTASHWVPRPLSLIKKTKCEADYWPPSTAEENPEYAVGTETSIWADERRTVVWFKAEKRGIFPPQIIHAGCGFHPFP